MKVELAEQLLFDVQFGVVGAKQKAVGQDHRRPSAGLEPVHDNRHEQVSGFTAGQIGRKVVFHICFFAATVGRIHQNNVHPILSGVVQHIMQQSIVVVDTRVVEVVQQQVGDTEHIGELLFLDAVDGIAESRLIFGGLDLLVQLLQPAGQKAAGTAGKVGHLLPYLGPDHLGHKVSDGPGRIEFAGRTCALQLFQNGLVDLAEGVAFRIIVQLEIVNRIDDLAQQDAVLHVVVGLGKHSLDNSLSDGRIGIHRQILQSREQGVVNEVQKFVSGHLLPVFSGCPVLPAAGLRNDGLIVFIIPFPVRLFGGVYLQKQQPGDLLDALGVAGVVAHDIPQPFDKSR